MSDSDYDNSYYYSDSESYYSNGSGSSYYDSSSGNTLSSSDSDENELGMNYYDLSREFNTYSNRQKR